MASEWRERIGNGPAIAGTAMPTRSGTHEQWDRMARWDREHDATRTLAKAGVKVDKLADAPAKLKALGG